MSAGKTIAWIDENPADPEYGGDDEGTLIIHFTDGTALKIEGHSYDPVSLSPEPMSQEDVRRRALAVQGQREQKRLKNLERQEWLAVSCDERAARVAAREAKMSPFARLIRDTYVDAYAGLLQDSNRMVYGDQPERRYRVPCTRCHERSCENATEKVAPAQKGFDWKGATFSVQTVSLKPDSDHPDP